MQAAKRDTKQGNPTKTRKKAKTEAEINPGTRPRAAASTPRRCHGETAATT